MTAGHSRLWVNRPPGTRVTSGSCSSPSVRQSLTAALDGDSEHADQLLSAANQDPLLVLGDVPLPL